jgi:hypothetical protein
MSCLGRVLAMPRNRNWIVVLAALTAICQPAQAQLNNNNFGSNNFFPQPINGNIGDGNNLPPPNNFQPNLLPPLNNNYFYLPPAGNIVVPKPTPVLFNNSINTMPQGPSMNINRNFNMTQSFEHLLTNSVNSRSVDTVMVQVASNKSQMIMFTAANQVFTGARGRKLTGRAGTTISMNKDLVVLFSGRLKAESGKNATTIDTPKCKISLAADASVVVDAQPGKPVRIMALASGTDSGSQRMVSVAPAAEGAAAIDLQPGEELIIGDSQLSEEDLIPADGVVRTVLSGGIQKQTYSIAKTQFSLADFNAQESAPSKSVRLTSARITSGLQQPESTKAHYTRKTFTHAGGSVNLYASDDAVVSMDAAGDISLDRGNLLVSPASAVSLHCKHADVVLTAGALVMVEEKSHLMRLKAFTGPEHARVKVQNQTIQLLPGEELLLSDNVPSANDLTPVDGIGRRIRYSMPGRQNGAMVVSDFSIPLTLAHRNIREMIRANDGLYGKVLKTAVIVEMVTKGRGRYTVATNPEMISHAPKQ